MRRTITMIQLFIISVIIFAVVYYILGKYDGTSFNKKRELSIIEAIYFSFVTQSTIGYGDFSPNTHIAKIVVIIHILVTYILFGLTVLV